MQRYVTGHDLASLVRPDPDGGEVTSMQIMIVDDEAAVANVLASAVRQGGHDAIVATDGREALALLDQARPDAVFLDLRMPDVGGLTVLRSIRSSHPTLPVIVITGHAADAEIEEARQLGVTDVIEKPFILNALTTALAAL
jgi:CheY-like chemotaxis protein